MDNNFNRLNELYQDKRLVPFLGAGMSIPFADIGWGRLIELIAVDGPNYNLYRDELNQFLTNMEYIEALEFLQSQCEYEKFEKYLKRKVKLIYQNLHISLKDQFNKIDNNYIDLLKYGFQTFFTFNYDHFMESVSEDTAFLMHTKILGRDIMDTQNIAHNNQDPVIWHVHGDYENVNSIILSPKSYQKMYQNKSFCNHLSFCVNHFVFLFMGVSFQDAMIQDFFEKNRKIFEKNNHYILFSEIDKTDETFLNKNYGLNVIRYPIADGHVAGIRKILNQLFSKLGNDETGKTQGINTEINLRNVGTANINYGTITNTYHINLTGGK